MSNTILVKITPPDSKIQTFEIQCACGHKLEGILPQEMHFIIECIKCGQRHTYIVNSELRIAD